MNARPFRSVLVVLAALGVLTACNSTPSARRVAFDAIETLDQPESVKQCMRDKVEGYSQDEIQAFAEGADQDDPESEEALAAFEDDLAECTSAG